jgi:hypothetical protein
MKRICIVLAAMMVGAAPAPAQEKAPGNDTIRKEDLRADLFFLAGDEMRGRLVDTPENRLAAEWIRSRFERLGLKPAAGGSFFQAYNLSTFSLGEENWLHVREGGAAVHQRKMGQDFYPLTYSGSGGARGAVVFAGFGISAPHLSHDDYRNADVRGKIALILDHEPGERDAQSPFDGVVTSDASTGWRKAVAAQNAGAIALLIVADVHNHPGERNFEAAARNAWPAEPPRVRRFTLQSWAERVRIPVVQIAPALAEIVLRGTNRTLEELAASAEARGGVSPVSLTGVEVEVSTAVNRHTIPDRNVVAVLEGADPKLKQEVVVVCAHYDHDGADGTRILNGADDDGSGTVGLLEIAEAFAEAARAGKRPRRSILFAAWNSEERGLLGAWAYTEQPPFPLEKIAAVLNMDMIGRNEEVPEGGGGRFRGLPLQTAESNKNAVGLLGYTWSASLLGEIKKANAAIGLELQTRYDNSISNLLRRSDHWPFLNRGVPAVWFHTGLHPDYHTPYDRPEKINYEKMERVARLVHQAAWNLANQDARPALDKKTP